MLLLASSVCGLFKWRQFEPEIILLAVGWYLRFSPSYRDVEDSFSAQISGVFPQISTSHIWRFGEKRSFLGVAMPFVSGMLGFCLLDEIPLIKGNRGVAVYRWNATLNRWTECHGVLLTPLWPIKLIFTPLYRLEWPFLSTNPPD